MYRSLNTRGIFIRASRVSYFLLSVFLSRDSNPRNKTSTVIVRFCSLTPSMKMAISVTWIKSIKQMNEYRSLCSFNTNMAEEVYCKMINPTDRMIYNWALISKSHSPWKTHHSSVSSLSLVFLTLPFLVNYLWKKSIFQTFVPAVVRLGFFHSFLRLLRHLVVFHFEQGTRVG